MPYIDTHSAVGADIARVLSSLGAKVILAARREAQLQEVAESCKGETVVQVLDVLDTDSHPRILQELVDRHGPIDILVDNAGRTQRSPVDETSVEVHRQMFELNVVGALSVAQATLPHMLRAGKGKILVTSSVAGVIASPVSATYAATKHALHGFFKTLRGELLHRGIDVTLACPGPIATPIVKNAFTGETGKLLSEEVVSRDTTRRMTSQRCAELMVRALYHGIPEVWISPNPFLAFTALAHYLPPSVTALFMSRIAPKKVEALKNGHHGYESIQSLSSLLGK